MDPQHLYLDHRLLELCAYCCVADTSTRDHVPSKVLLDEPFPSDLAVVGACFDCNNGLSVDEQYLACLLEAVVTGTADPAGMKREKVRSILNHNPSLAARIAASRHIDDAGNSVWQVEEARIQAVLLKLARGHVAHQIGELRPDQPSGVWFRPLCTMSNEDITAFESPVTGTLLPEIGSRMFIKATIVGQDIVTGEGEWHDVQQGRYRYAVSWSDGIIVRLVIGDYLACEVSWAPDDVSSAPVCY